MIGKTSAYTHVVYYRTMSCIRKIKKHKQQPETATTQVQPDPSYLPQVVEKLKKHPDYKDIDWNDEEWKEEARELTEPAKLHVKFSHLTDELFEHHVQETGDEISDAEDDGKFAHEEENQKARIRMKNRLDSASKLPVRLLLRELKSQTLLPTSFASKFAKKYGPFHAALQIGDVVVEWDDSSLVTPTRGDFEDPIFRGDMSKKTSASVAAVKLETQMSAAVHQMDFNKSIDLIYNVSVNRKVMIDKLIDVISRYNKRYSYKLLSRNCHNFTSDAMKAMGISKCPEFGGKLKQYFDELKKGKTVAIPEDFPNHEELDRYVMRIKDELNLTAYDKEYLLCLYFQFHIQALRREEDPDAVACKVATCKMGMLEKLIDGQPLLLLTSA